LLSSTTRYKAGASFAISGSRARSRAEGVDGDEASGCGAGAGLARRVRVVRARGTEELVQGHADGDAERAQGRGLLHGQGGQLRYLTRQRYRQLHGRRVGIAPGWRWLVHDPRHPGPLGGHAGARHVRGDGASVRPQEVTVTGDAYVT